ncbi:hypothetical protein TELCIR_15911, partial [Teladorsagia circumcincta]
MDGTAVRSRLAQGLVPNGYTGRKVPRGANINQLTYSNDLEHDAQVYANTCPYGPSSEMSRNGQGENFAIISSYDAQSSVLIAAFKAIKTFWREIKTSQGINRRMQFTEHFRNRQDAPLRFTQ